MQKKPIQNLIERPPVIAIMGHIDHGKSTLLDYIRHTNITAKEAGGITQHIGAYEVIHKNGDGKERKITFLDTPGHAAFKGIRTRGANVADIAVLVVSGEDGVKPQTLEALQSILSAKIPYIVAINKIDSPKADVERTKQNLAENEIYLENYGGQVPWVPISAKTGEGIPQLLDLMLLMAEVGEFKADPNAAAEGVVIETNLDKKKGVSATLIIKNGTLRNGMTVVSGESIAPVRIMENFKGERVAEASFSSPIKLIGFDITPKVGDTFKSYENKKAAEAAIEEEKATPSQAPEKKVMTNSTGPAPEIEPLNIPLIVKADSAGSLEAIENEIQKIKQERVKIKIVHSGIGEISENDIKAASGHEHALMVGFHTRIDNLAKSTAERNGIEIHLFDIIYKLIEWVEQVAKEKAPKFQVEEITGKAKILKIFSKSKDKQVLGGKVIEGVITSGEEVKIIRREAEIGRGRIRELQQQKVKATEAKKDTEFGAMIESKIEIVAGDQILVLSYVTK